MSDTYRPAEPSVHKQFDLSGKVAVVTGGAGFLGVQFAAALAEMGARVTLFDVKAASLQTAAKSVTDAWGPCEGEVADVTDEQSVRAAAANVIARHGRIDILVNAAGLTKYGCDADPETFFAPFEDSDRGVWEAGLAANLTGVMTCCKVVGAGMAERNGGSIINIASDIGVISPDQRIYAPDEHGYPGVDFNSPIFYSVSKAGVIHLTKHLATLWAPHGVRVNAVSPAGVYRNHDPGFVKQLASRIPMGRMARENEFKGAIAFLASDASSFMTGHNLVIDGGRTIW